MIHGFHVTLYPFSWVWPAYERTICDTSIRFGPVTIGWMNCN
jgi:hypothetical protein